jgi:hypothetical protein
MVFRKKQKILKVIIPSAVFQLRKTHQKKSLFTRKAKRDFLNWSKNYFLFRMPSATANQDAGPPAT